MLLDAGGRAALCDFGTRWAAGHRWVESVSSLSVGGGGGGGARYRDPAVACGRNALRKASDMYSFGVLAWAVVTGEVPYAGMDAAAIAAFSGAQPQGGRPELEALARVTSTPEALKFLVAQCWLDTQHDRPTASRVCAVLEGICRGS